MLCDVKLGKLVSETTTASRERTAMAAKQRVDRGPKHERAAKRKRESGSPAPS